MDGKRAAIRTLLFTSLILAATTHAASAEACAISTLDTEGSMSFIVAAIALVSSTIAIAYMYSKLREDAQMGVWAKDEAGNLLVTVFLFVGLVAVFQGSCDIAKSYTHGKAPLDAAGSYLDRLIQANGMNVLRQLTYGSVNNQFTATQYWYIGATPFYGHGAATYANARTLSAQKEFVIDLYIPLLASLNAQKYLLQGINWIGLSLVLPFAFVMRLLPPTREFGNLLVALFFTIYIVVPTLYAMSGEAFEKIVATPRCVDCSVHNFYNFALDEGDGRDGGAASAATWQNSVMYRIGSTIPQAVFLPNLVLVVSITCIMSLSKALKSIAV